MQVVAISRGPTSAKQLKRLEEAGCRLIAKTLAEDTMLALMTWFESDHGLTPRQLEVLQHTAKGLPLSEIADKLGVSRKTVERHLRHCRQRLSAANDVQLGVVAERLGL